MSSAGPSRKGKALPQAPRFANPFDAARARAGKPKPQSAKSNGSSQPKPAASRPSKPAAHPAPSSLASKGVNRVRQLSKAGQEALGKKIKELQSATAKQLRQKDSERKEAEKPLRKRTTQLKRELSKWKKEVLKRQQPQTGPSGPVVPDEMIVYANYQPDRHCDPTAMPPTLASVGDTEHGLGLKPDEFSCLLAACDVAHQFGRSEAATTQLGTVLPLSAAFVAEGVAHPPLPTVAAGGADAEVDAALAPLQDLSQVASDATGDLLPLTASKTQLAHLCQAIHSGKWRDERLIHRLHVALTRRILEEVVRAEEAEEEEELASDDEDNPKKHGDADLASDAGVGDDGDGDSQGCDSDDDGMEDEEDEDEDDDEEEDGEEDGAAKAGSAAASGSGAAAKATAGADEEDGAEEDEEDEEDDDDGDMSSVHSDDSGVQGGSMDPLVIEVAGTASGVEADDAEAGAGGGAGLESALTGEGALISLLSSSTLSVRPPLPPDVAVSAPRHLRMSLGLLSPLSWLATLRHLVWGRGNGAGSSSALRNLRRLGSPTALAALYYSHRCEYANIPVNGKIAILRLLLDTFCTLPATRDAIDGRAKRAEDLQGQLDSELGKLARKFQPKRRSTLKRFANRRADAEAALKAEQKRVKAEAEARRAEEKKRREEEKQAKAKAKAQAKAKAKPASKPAVDKKVKGEEEEEEEEEEADDEEAELESLGSFDEAEAAKAGLSLPEIRQARLAHDKEREERRSLRAEKEEEEAAEAKAEEEAKVLLEEMKAECKKPVPSADPDRPIDDDDQTVLSCGRLSGMLSRARSLGLEKGRGRNKHCPPEMAECRLALVKAEEAVALQELADQQREKESAIRRRFRRRARELGVSTGWNSLGQDASWREFYYLPWDKKRVFVRSESAAEAWGRQAAAAILDRPDELPEAVKARQAWFEERLPAAAEMAALAAGPPAAAPADAAGGEDPPVAVLLPKPTKRTGTEAVTQWVDDFAGEAEAMLLRNCGPPPDAASGTPAAPVAAGSSSASTPGPAMRRRGSSGRAGGADLLPLARGVQWSLVQTSDDLQHVADATNMHGIREKQLLKSIQESEEQLMTQLPDGPEALAEKQAQEQRERRADQRGDDDDSDEEEDDEVMITNGTAAAKEEDEAEDEDEATKASKPSDTPRRRVKLGVKAAPSSAAPVTGRKRTRLPASLRGLEGADQETAELAAALTEGRRPRRAAAAHARERLRDTAMGDVRGGRSRRGGDDDYVAGSDDDEDDDEDLYEAESRRRSRRTRRHSPERPKVYQTKSGRTTGTGAMAALPPSLASLGRTVPKYSEEEIAAREAEEQRRQAARAARLAEQRRRQEARERRRQARLKVLAGPGDEGHPWDAAPAPLVGLAMLLVHSLHLVRSLEGRLATPPTQLLVPPSFASRHPTLTGEGATARKAALAKELAAGATEALAGASGAVQAACEAVQRVARRLQRGAAAEWTQQADSVADLLQLAHPGAPLLKQLQDVLLTVEESLSSVQRQRRRRGMRLTQEARSAAGTGASAATKRKHADDDDDEEEDEEEDPRPEGWSDGEEAASALPRARWQFNPERRGDAAATPASPKRTARRTERAAASSNFEELYDHTMCALWPLRAFRLDWRRRVRCSESVSGLALALLELRERAAYAGLIGWNQVLASLEPTERRRLWSGRRRLADSKRAEGKE